MRPRLHIKLIDLVLVEDEEVLNCKGEGFHHLASTFRFVRRHELTEFAQMQEVASSLGEIFTELLKRLRCAAEVADDEIWVCVERERGLF